MLLISVGYFARGIKSTKSIEGQDVSFSCEVFEENTESQWFKDGVKVCDDQKYEIRSIGKYHRLTIRSADLSDRGDFMVNVNGRTRTADLIVRGKMLLCEVMFGFEINPCIRTQ